MYRVLIKLKAWRALGNFHKSGPSLVTAQFRASSGFSFASACSSIRPGNLTLTARIMSSSSQSETDTRPTWFVFSGVGSNNPNLGNSLLRLPAFAASIARSAAALVPYGIDLQHVISGEGALDIPSHFLSIIAVQVALVDLLRELGVRPDGIIGFSYGETGAAYADGAMSAEQVITIAPLIGRSIIDARPPRGATAVIERSWQDIAPRCSSDIDCATHLLSDKITVSGPPASIEKLVAELSAEGVSVQFAESMGIPFHTRYMVRATELLRDRLQLIKPMPRSKRWLSCSVPPEQWGSDMAKLVNSAYISNIIKTPVYFSAALAHVPPRARVLEFAPHAHLQSTLKRALPFAQHVPLLRREAPDALEHLLKALEIVAPGSHEKTIFGNAMEIPPFRDCVVRCENTSTIAHFCHNT